MHLEDLLIGNISMQIYIQNPCHPEISLVPITLCPRNIILVYLACEKIAIYTFFIVRCGAGAGLNIEGCGAVRAPALNDCAVRCGCGPLHCGAVRLRAKLLGPRRASHPIRPIYKVCFIVFIYIYIYMRTDNNLQTCMQTFISQRPNLDYYL